MDAAYLGVLARVKEAATREMDRIQVGCEPSAGLLLLLRHEHTDGWMEAQARWLARQEDTDPPGA